MPKLLMAPQQLILEVPTYFNHRISLDMEGPIFLSSGGNSYVFVIVDAFTHYVFLLPSPRIDAANGLNVLFDIWMVKFGTPNILVTKNGSKFVNGEFAHFCRIYNVQYKPRTPWSIGLVKIVIYN